MSLPYFSFSQATSSFVKQQDQQKNPFTLNRTFFCGGFSKGRNSFEFCCWMKLSMSRLKRLPQMQCETWWWGFTWLNLPERSHFLSKNGSKYCWNISNCKDEIEHSKDHKKHLKALFLYSHQSLYGNQHGFRGFCLEVLTRRMMVVLLLLFFLMDA